MASTLGIRKAAIFIDCLEPEAADRLLERLPLEYAQQVRNTWMTLGRISAEERDQVIREFLIHAGTNKLPLPQQPTGGEEKSESGPRNEEVKVPNVGPKDRPFQMLQEAETEKLVSILAGERSPTIALVLAHLPPTQAGAVLVRFPAATQIEIIRCLLQLEETDPDILREIDKALQEKLAQISTMSRRHVAGLTTITGIVQQCKEAIADQVLDTLHTIAPEVAQQLAPVPAIDFNQFIRFDDSSLGVIFDHASLEVAVLALWGAPLGLVERVLNELPTWKAKSLKEQLSEIGPVRLRDVEEARRRLGELARQLAMARKIKLPKEIYRGNAQTTTTETIRTNHEPISQFVQIIE